MNDIDRSIEYCTSFDPGLPAKLRGAPPERIARLEELLGRPLSTEHRRFLERMGVDKGWLEFWEFDTSAEAVIRAHETTQGPIPEGFELLAVATDEPFEDLFLVNRGYNTAGVEAINTRVGCDYANLVGDQGNPLAGSLAEFLCVRPLERHRMNSLPLRSMYGQHESSEPLLARFDEIAAHLGFTPMWFSTWMTRVVVRGSTVAVARQAPEYPLVVYLASSERTPFEESVRLLEGSLGLVRNVHAFNE